MRRMLTPHSLLLAATLCAAASLVMAQPAPSVQTRIEAGRLTITVEDAWPLERAIYEVQKLCGCAISFENPPLQNPADLVDDTVRPGVTGSYRALRPRPARFEFSFPAVLPLDDQTAAAIVHQLVGEYEQRGLPGRFRVDVAHGIIHVVPTAVENEAGQLAAVSPVLTTNVSLSQAERSVDETVRAIISAVAAQSGRPIAVVAVPRQLFLRHRTTAAVFGEPAREALGRVLESLPQRVSWRLRYRPGAGDYTISFDTVPPAPVP